MENKTRKSKLRSIIVSVSILLNICFLFNAALDIFTDCVGILTRNVSVGRFSDTTVIFTLPKGLTVRDASPQSITAIGQFEPYRFSIVFTSNDEHLVNYHISKDSLNRSSEMYSLER